MWICARHTEVAAFYRIEEIDLVQQLVELAITCRDCLLELTDFTLVYFDRDLNITSEKLTTALKVLIFHCLIIGSLYVLFFFPRVHVLYSGDVGLSFIYVCIYCLCNSLPSFFFSLPSAIIILLDSLLFSLTDGGRTRCKCVQTNIILLVAIGFVAHRQLKRLVSIVNMETTGLS